MISLEDVKRTLINALNRADIYKYTIDNYGDSVALTHVYYCPTGRVPTKHTLTLTGTPSFSIPGVVHYTVSYDGVFMNGSADPYVLKYWVYLLTRHPEQFMPGYEVIHDDVYMLLE